MASFQMPKGGNAKLVRVNNFLVHSFLSPLHPQHYLNCNPKKVGQNLGKDAEYSSEIFQMILLCIHTLGLARCTVGFLSILTEL